MKVQMALAASGSSLYIAISTKVYKVVGNTAQELFDVTSFPEVESKEKPEDEQKKQKPEIVEILCCCVSKCGSLLAVGTNEKKFHVWDVVSSSLKTSFLVIKAPQSACFDATSDSIVVGDRAGDVYRYRLDFAKLEEISGSVSMALDVLISTDGRWLITADRDEKVRISRYPQSFVIQWFCLGHTEYVRSLAQLDDSVWSAGGDGVIREWSLTTGASVSSSQRLSPDKSLRKIAALKSENGVLVGAAVEEDSSFYISHEGLERVEHVQLDENILDIAVLGSRFVVLTRGGLYLIDEGKTVESVELDGELKKKLSESKDAVANLFKNVTFNNKAAYEMRKSEKFEKINAKKAQKRKLEVAR
ncbi:unnamed protein product [Caenorhabditis auriculariae]|uniref:tRNA (guanine-N(7)-)-methyltransferase non-catalytic subunit n=1 Tax=Caenorhabditis auriculariae TaxID=2777116 RepID=A0A8S1GZM5_9PELO|nr:unnamed protein product [Caenorhabditis auriculariae]